MANCADEYGQCTADTSCKEAIFCHLECLEGNPNAHSDCEHHCFLHFSDDVSDALLLCMAHNGCSGAVVLDENYDVCVQELCGTQIDTCVADEECASFLECEGSCLYNLDCIEECWEAHPSDLADDVAACAAVCEPRDDSEACVQSHCSTQHSVCARDVSCLDFLRCRHHCYDSESPHACEAACAHSHPSDATDALTQCVIDNDCDPDVYDLTDDNLQCIADTCDVFLQFCAEDPECSPAVECVDRCGPSSACIESCFETHPSISGEEVEMCVGYSGCLPEDESCWLGHCRVELHGCSEHWLCEEAVVCREECVMEGHHEDHCVSDCFDSVAHVTEVVSLLDCGADSGCYTRESNDPHHHSKKHHNKKRHNKKHHNKKHHNKKHHSRLSQVGQFHPLSTDVELGSCWLGSSHVYLRETLPKSDNRGEFYCSWYPNNLDAFVDHCDTCTPTGTWYNCQETYDTYLYYAYDYDASAGPGDNFFQVQFAITEWAALPAPIITEVKMSWGESELHCDTEGALHINGELYDGTTMEVDGVTLEYESPSSKSRYYRVTYGDHYLTLWVRTVYKAVVYYLILDAPIDGGIGLCADSEFPLPKDYTLGREEFPPSLFE